MLHIEYGLEGLVSIRGDVYSYGILLMETFTRRKPTDDMFAGEMSLKRWVEESSPFSVTKVVDVNLLRTKKDYASIEDCISSIMGLHCTVVQSYLNRGLMQKIFQVHSIRSN